MLTYYYMHTIKKLSRNLKIFSSCKQKGSVRIIYRFTLQIGRFLGRHCHHSMATITTVFFYTYIIKKESATCGTLLLLALPYYNVLLILPSRHTKVWNQLCHRFFVGFKIHTPTSRTDSHCRTFHIPV